MIRRCDKLVAVKIVLAGDGAVGKSTLSNRLSKTLNQNENLPLTSGLSINKISIPEQKVSGVIWDLGGQKQFRFLHKDFIKGAKIIVFVYSVERINSLIDMSQWIEMVPKDKLPLKIYLVANKVDSEKRIITKEEGEKYAVQNNMTYYEVSAKNGNGFDEFEKDIIDTISKIANFEKNIIKDESISKEFCTITM